MKIEKLIKEIDKIKEELNVVEVIKTLKEQIFILREEIKKEFAEIHEVLTILHNRTVVYEDVVKDVAKIVDKSFSEHEDSVLNIIKANYKVSIEKPEWFFILENGNLAPNVIEINSKLNNIQNILKDFVK